MRSVSAARAAIVFGAILAVCVSGSAQGPAGVRTAGDPVAHGTPRVFTGGVSEHLVARGETLRGIGSRYGIDPAVIAADNGLTLTGALKVGQSLRIDNRHIVPAFREPGGIVLNVPQRMLFFEAADGTRAFPAAVGRRDWTTPLGEFSIVTKETDPTWDVPVSIRAEARRAGRELPATVPPGPANPLGKYWLGLSLAGIGIHGTNAPSSIYQTVTHGCIRLHPDDIQALQALVRVGTTGRVVYEPILLAVVGDEVYVESHPDAYRLLTEGADARLRALTDAAGVTARMDWNEAGRILSARDGIARIMKLEGARQPISVPSARGRGVPAFDSNNTAGTRTPAPAAGCPHG